MHLLFSCSFLIIICYNQNNIRQSFTYLPCSLSRKTHRLPHTYKQNQHNLIKLIFSYEKAAEIVRANALLNHCKAMGRLRWVMPSHCRSGQRVGADSKAILNSGLQSQVLLANSSLQHRSLRFSLVLISLDRPWRCLAGLPPASQSSLVWCSHYSCLCSNVWYSLSLEKPERMKIKKTHEMNLFQWFLKAHHS